MKKITKKKKNESEVVKVNHVQFFRYKTTTNIAQDTYIR